MQIGPVDAARFRPAFALRSFAMQWRRRARRAARRSLVDAIGELDLLARRVAPRRFPVAIVQMTRAFLDPPQRPDVSRFEQRRRSGERDAGACHVGWRDRQRRIGVEVQIGSVLERHRIESPVRMSEAAQPVRWVRRMHAKQHVGRLRPLQSGKSRDGIGRRYLVRSAVRFLDAARSGVEPEILVARLDRI